MSNRRFLTSQRSEWYKMSPYSVAVYEFKQVVSCSMWPLPRHFTSSLFTQQCRKKLVTWGIIRQWWIFNDWYVVYLTTGCSEVNAMVLSPGKSVTRLEQTADVRPHISLTSSFKKIQFYRSREHHERRPLNSHTSYIKTDKLINIHDYNFKSLIFMAIIFSVKKPSGKWRH